jgi:hypothetical protein
VEIVQEEEMEIEIEIEIEIEMSAQLQIEMWLVVQGVAIEDHQTKDDPK